MFSHGALFMIIYKLWAYGPWLFAFAFYMFIMARMFEMRMIHQGQPFQVARSAFYGGGALFSTYAIAGGAIKVAGTSALPVFSTEWWFHGLCLLAGIIAGQVFQSLGHGWDRKKWSSNTERADLFYAIYLVPLIVYLCLVSVPVIVWVEGPFEIAFTIALYVILLQFFNNDRRNGLLDQTTWLKAHPLKSVTDAHPKKV